MRHAFKRRLISSLVCLCLVLSLSTGYAKEEKPVSSTDFTLAVSLEPSAFANAGSRIKDWATFLDKLSLKGTLLAHDFVGDDEQLQLDAELLLSGKSVLPLQMNYVNSSVWVNSPALGKRTVQGSMLNFFEFMLKPYFFMGMRTDLVSLLLYPKGTAWVGRAYYNKLDQVIGGKKSYTVPYQKLHELCLELDDLMFNEDFLRPYRLVRQMLLGLAQEESTLTALGDLESWLDMLDPDQKGLSVKVKGGQTQYVIGEKTLMTRTNNKKGNHVQLSLPDTEGRLLEVDYLSGGSDWSLKLCVTRETGENGLTLFAQASGLPQQDEPTGKGEIRLGCSGAALEGGLDLTLPFGWTTDTSVTPRKTTWTLSLIVPDTGKTGATVTLTEQTTQDVGRDAFAYQKAPNEFDIFGMNGPVLHELIDDIKKPMLLTLLPILLEMPAGVINDIASFTYNSNILTTIAE